MLKILLILALIFSGISFAEDAERGVLPQGQEWRECAAGGPVIQCATLQCDDICSKMLEDKKAEEAEQRKEEVIEEIDQAENQGPRPPPSE